MAKRKNLSPRLRFRVLDRDRFRCCYCGSPAVDGETLEVDHIIPVAEGGPDTMGNLLTACSTCNSGKSDHRVGLTHGMALRIACSNPEYALDPEQMFSDGPLGYDLMVAQLRFERQESLARDAAKQSEQEEQPD